MIDQDVRKATAGASSLEEGMVRAARAAGGALLVTMAAFGWQAVHPNAAFAASCPTATTPTTVAATPASPGYTFVRGCIVSFDGTSIVYDLYEPLDASAAHPVYALLEEPGWGGWGPYASDCALSTSGVGADPPVALGADYAFLTWDPRGFGQSGGVSEVNDPLAEGRDVSSLVDQVLTGRPEIAVDHTRQDHTYGQPAVGMMGGSYGGGIQFAAAAFDARIKAIVPQWAWNDLNYSLWPGGVPKQTFFEFLFAEGAGLSSASHYADLESCTHTAGTQVTPIYDPNLFRNWAQVTSAGYPDAQTLSWFAQRSMAGYGSGPNGRVPHVPTLMIQGTTDTLFNLNDAWANYQMIKAADASVPVKLIGFCGGHAGCQYSSTPPSGFEAHVPDATFVDDAEINWFDVYLRHDAGATDSLPSVLLQDQRGVWHSLDSFPTAAAPGAAAFTSTPVSGTVVSAGVPTDANNPLIFYPEDYATPSNSNDPGTLTVPVLTVPAHGSAVFIAGEPHVDLNVTVDGSSADLFFKLVDVGRNGACTEPCWQGASAVVDGQTAAIRLDNLDLANGAGNPNLPPTTEHVSLDMVGVGYLVPPGDTLELQISSASAPSASNRGVAVTSVQGSVELPTVADNEAPPPAIPEAPWQPLLLLLGALAPALLLSRRHRSPS
jgi:ABC-2 type transport system ATP-binding protein